MIRKVCVFVCERVYACVRFYECLPCECNCMCAYVCMFLRVCLHRVSDMDVLCVCLQSFYFLLLMCVSFSSVRVEIHLNTILCVGLKVRREKGSCFCLPELKICNKGPAYMRLSTNTHCVTTHTDTQAAFENVLHSTYFVTGVDSENKPHYEVILFDKVHS